VKFLFTCTNQACSFTFEGLLLSRPATFDQARKTKNTASHWFLNIALGGHSK
jgi:hypothetical protein